MTVKYIAKVGNEYIYNHSPGVAALTRDIGKAWRFSSVIEAEEMHRDNLEFSYLPLKVIKEQQEKS